MTKQLAKEYNKINVLKWFKDAGPVFDYKNII